MRNRDKGKKGELIAQKWVKSKLRLEILETNFRSPWGEIDIIARDRDTWVFIEVKTREPKGWTSRRGSHPGKTK